MNLSERKNTVILHYGCADFNKPVHTIFWIGAIYYDNQVKNYFFENGNERDIIERFRRRLTLKRKVILFRQGVKFIKLLGRFFGVLLSILLSVSAIFTVSFEYIWILTLLVFK